MTMNEQNTSVIPFAFDDALVRALWVENDPWFVLVDVCRVLGIANSRDAASRLDDDEKADVGITDTSSNGVEQGRSVTVVSESGLYALIFRSRKPEAKRFRKWVTSEVIPSLRKTGRYAMPGASDDPAPSSGWNAACWDRSEMTAMVSMVRECRSLWGKAAARQLWQSLPLPPAGAVPGAEGGEALEVVWWRERLKAGEQIPGLGEWASEVPTAAMAQAFFNAYGHERYQDVVHAAPLVGRVLREMVPGLERQRASRRGRWADGRRRVWVYRFPGLAACRAMMGMGGLGDE
jgi:prophage antirepressor-like protein